jgi:Ca-activated chloride channel family protein
MLFFNQEHKTLEGELDFPIPENAVICGYAYEYDGYMIPASVVEKEQARVTFEKEVRSGGVASLVEHVKGATAVFHS